MPLKWKEKRGVCTLSGTHSQEIQTVHDKIGITEQNPKVCIDYSDAKGVADFSGRNIVIYSVTRERMKNTIRRFSNTC